MEVRVYNPQLQLMGVVEDFISLLWNRKYNTAGDFELYVPITSDNVRYFVRGNIVAYLGAAEAGVIESLEAQQDNKKNQMIIKGRFLESYLDRRLIYTGDPTQKVSHTVNYSGNTETAMRSLITNAAAIPLLELGEIKGFTDTITFQATFQNLLKYESKLAQSASLGFRCIPDFVNKKIIFDIYKGLDHSESQSDRVRVTFSDSYNNIDSADYTENDQLLRTVCFVGGQGEGAEREWVIAGDNALTGLERREVRLDATDVSPDDLTTEQYREKLAERGRSLLEDDDILVKSFECQTIPDGNFIYKEHYDIGDIVTIKKESWNISVDLRITAITETYEHGKAEINPTFGNPLPDTIDWEDK